MKPSAIFPDALALITEAYCVEHNIPCRGRFRHDELAPAIQAVRQAHSQLYATSTPAPTVSATRSPVDIPESGE